MGRGKGLELALQDSNHRPQPSIVIKHIIVLFVLRSSNSSMDHYGQQTNHR